jgi:hypothetical protein
LIPDFTKPTARDLFRWIHNLVANVSDQATASARRC